MTSNLKGPHRIELPLLVHGRGNHKNCRWACGNQCFHEVPNRSDNETFTAVVERALSRRSFLAAGGVGALVLSAAVAPADASEYPPVGPYRPTPTGRRLAFTPIAPNTIDDVVLAEGYADRLLIAWGDPIRPGAPEFDFDAQSPRAQARHFGYNTTTWPSSPCPGGARTRFWGCCGRTTSTPTRS